MKPRGFDGVREDVRSVWRGCSVPLLCGFLLRRIPAATKVLSRPGSGVLLLN